MCDHRMQGDPAGGHTTHTYTHTTLRADTIAGGHTAKRNVLPDFYLKLDLYFQPKTVPTPTCLQPTTVFLRHSIRNQIDTMYVQLTYLHLPVFLF